MVPSLQSHTGHLPLPIHPTLNYPGPNADIIGGPSVLLHQRFMLQYEKNII